MPIENLAYTHPSKIRKKPTGNPRTDVESLSNIRLTKIQRESVRLAIRTEARKSKIAELASSEKENFTYSITILLLKISPHMGGHLYSTVSRRLGTYPCSRYPCSRETPREQGLSAAKSCRHPSQADQIHPKISFCKLHRMRETHSDTDSFPVDAGSFVFDASSFFFDANHPIRCGITQLGQCTCS